MNQGKEVMVFRDLHSSLRYLVQLAHHVSNGFVPFQRFEENGYAFNSNERLAAEFDAFDSWVEERGLPKEKHVLMPLTIFVDEARMRDTGTVKSATAIFLAPLMVEERVKNSGASKVLLGVTSQHTMLQKLVKDAFVDPLLRIRTSLDASKHVVVEGVTYHPRLFLVLGDDVGHRAISGLSGWIGLLSRYHTDECGRYKRTAAPNTTSGKRSTTNSVSDHFLPAAPAPMIKLSSNRNVRSARVTIRLYRRLLRCWELHFEEEMDVSRLLPKVEAEFKAAGVRWPGWSKKKPEIPCLLLLEECMESLYEMLAPCLLHLWQLGLLKRMWFWIGQVLGQELRGLINDAVRTRKLLPGIDTLQREDIWASSSECAPLPGNFWRELTKYGHTILTVTLRRGISSGVPNNCAVVSTLLQHTASLQNLLYRRKFTLKEVSDLEVLIQAWKQELVAVFSRVSINKRPINFFFPNFDNSAYLF